MKTLAVHEIEDREIRVVEYDDGSRAYLEGGVVYSHADARGNSLMPYCETMERALKGATDLLLLGTAGGSLATHLARQGVQVTAVDNVAAAFEFARDWFHLPAEVECVHADALEYMRSADRQWDAIAVDVFFHGQQIPEWMLTEEIGSLLARSLKAGGTVAWNVADSPQSWPVHWVSKTLRKAGFSPRPVAVVKEGAGNTVVVSRRVVT